MAENEYGWFVGVDWATQAHEVCVLDAARKLVRRMEVKHDGAALTQLADELTRLSGGSPERVAVAIETTRGAVVETLLERGIHVYAINPKQLDRFRDRHSVAGAKDDPRDAFVAADALATDRPLFRRLVPGSAWTGQLRELARAREDLQQQRLRLANQLRDLLLRYFPQVLALCGAADERWIWALLQKAPDPDKARSLRRAQIEHVLEEHRITRFSVDDVRRALEAASLRLEPGARAGIVERVRLLLPQLQLVDAQMRQVDKLIDRHLRQPADAEDDAGQKREHRDAEIILSLPGAGIQVAATMLAEASQPLAERDYSSLRALGGIAPVTRRTGKQGKGGRRAPAFMRRACSARLRKALYHWSRCALMHDERCKQLYADHRRCGQTHGRALRSVGDHLLRVLVAMLRNRTLFDATRRRGLPPAPAVAA